MNAQCLAREFHIFRRRSQHVCADAAPRLQIYKGVPKKFARSDLERPSTREFCATAHAYGDTAQVVPAVCLKVGTRATIPLCSEGPKWAIYNLDNSRSI